jgi:hypothetical protein
VLDASGKQGRYVKIQLLDSDYLSLAEVQVMGAGFPRARLVVPVPTAITTVAVS